MPDVEYVQAQHLLGHEISNGKVTAIKQCTDANCVDIAVDGKWMFCYAKSEKVATK